MERSDLSLGVAAGDKPKTAFTTRRGLFPFTRMPFGLCNAPSTIQRLIDCVLRGLTWVCCLVYLDDVIIFTKGSVTQHVVELAIVLERLSEAGLSLKASKCSFATTRMKYLGHDLMPEGIKPMERLVGAIVDFSTPTDDTQVRRFVALTGYYRRFVPEFGTRMPVLIYPDYRLPFKLTTDASKTGLGAINSPTVPKYSISELECLAVVWAVRLFRPHLYADTLRSSLIMWLMTAKEPTRRLHQWALTLQEYEFTTEYRPGRENYVADALSRGPAAGDAIEKEADTSDTLAIGPAEPTHNADNNSGDAETIIDHEAEAVIRVAQVQRVEAAELGIVQFTDEDVKIEQSTSNMVQRLKLKGSYRGKRVYEDDDRLWKVDIGDGESRMILPVVYRALAFKEAHDSIWLDIFAGLRRWSAYDDCIVDLSVPILWVTEGETKSGGSPLRSVRIGVVCDRWAIDVAGPLSRTEAGNRYVIAAVEYTTRYAVATAVPGHTAKAIARFLLEKMIMVFGPTR
ncbi:Gag-pol fusion protein [Phytophthora megakarya]|uniref:Gag-pol fusion protein n=1 Tax=Phytophthora megakarya TaxID=4795 RepID=A0A225WW08_9STRA|nr:Gag-pol fusion protein [Phytophthora megakarya]